jgi:2-oxoglutarate ferredoxin oxidoreductase subunit alpha
MKKPEKESDMVEMALKEKKTRGDYRPPTIKPGRYYLEGSQACVEGALLAGLKVYAGYPITPASEIMEHASRRLPQFGGRFIQMEDEMASASALIGASWAGAKAMSATSGPGFSLMQEVIGFAIMTETPLVIVDVQRPGPGQGYITTSQEDVMQARYGHHGEGSLIALAPASVQDMFELTIEAFNLSEKWRTPVLVMAEETVAHMREQLVVPELDTIEIIGRKKPQDLNIPPDAYLPYGHDIVPPMANFGEGYNINHVSLAHSEDGNVSNYSLEVHRENIERLHKKIEGNVNEIARIESQFLDEPDHLLICYGAVARTGFEAVKEAREIYGINIGFIRLVTLWPFPEEKLRSSISKVKNIYVPEMNLGLMKHPITEALRDKCERVISIPEIGALHSPEKIVEQIIKGAAC